MGNIKPLSLVIGSRFQIVQKLALILPQFVGKVCWTAVARSDCQLVASRFKFQTKSESSLPKINNVVHINKAFVCADSGVSSATVLQPLIPLIPSWFWHPLRPLLVAD